VLQPGRRVAFRRRRRARLAMGFVALVCAAAVVLLALT
jgi:hypothetical protein